MSTIIQNYPQGYIGATVSGQPNSQYIPTLADKILAKKTELVNSGFKEVSTNTFEKKENGKTIIIYVNDITGEITTTTKTETTPAKQVSEETAQLQGISREIKKTEGAIKSATNNNTKEYLVERLKDLQQMRSDLIKTGNAYTSKIIGAQTSIMETKNNIFSDVIITPSGFQSKASFLQTPEEKQATSNYFATENFQSRMGGYTSNVSVPLTSTPILIETTSKNLPRSEVQPASKVFGSPSIPEQVTRVGQDLITRGQLGGTSAGLYTVAGGGILLAKGAGETIISIPESLSPITYRGEWQVPIVTPIYKTGKSIITGELRSYAQENPVEFTGQIIGVAVGGKILDTGISKVSESRIGQVKSLRPEIVERTTSDTTSINFNQNILLNKNIIAGLSETKTGGIYSIDGQLFNVKAFENAKTVILNEGTGYLGTGTIIVESQKTGLTKEFPTITKAISKGDESTSRTVALSKIGDVDRLTGIKSAETINSGLRESKDLGLSYDITSKNVGINEKIIVGQSKEILKTSEQAVTGEPFQRTLTRTDVIDFTSQPLQEALSKLKPTVILKYCTIA